MEAEQNIVSLRQAQEKKLFCHIPQICPITGVPRMFVVSSYIFDASSGLFTYISPLVKKWFSPMVEYLDFPGEVSNLRIDRLRIQDETGLPAPHREIIMCLGDAQSVSVTLAEVFLLAQRQRDGKQDGPLLINGAENIFYVPQLITSCLLGHISYFDDQGKKHEEEVRPRYIFKVNGRCYVLRGVGLNLGLDGGWSLQGHRLDDAQGCHFARQVLTRNSFLEFDDAEEAQQIA